MQNAPRRHTVPVRNGPETRARHEIVFYDWGNPDAMNVTICVHGLTRNAHDFTIIAEELAKTGRRVIALNMAGRGESQWLDDPMSYHYGTYVADCLAIMDNFHLRGVEWIGTSMGGIIGMMIAAQQNGRIKKLILNDIGTTIEPPALARIYEYVRTMPTEFTDRAAAGVYMQEVYKPFGITDPGEWETFVNSSLLSGADGKLRPACDPAIAEPLRVATKDFTEIDAPDLTDIWQQIRIPSLIIRGSESDVLTGSTVHHMRLSNIKSQSIVIQGVGHAPMLNTPEQIDIVKRWLIEGNLKTSAFR